MGLLKWLPVVSKDLLEDIPVPRGGCHHRIAPSGGDQIVAMERLYHASAASSTPHPASLRYPHPTRLSLLNESFRDRKNAFSYTMNKAPYGWTLSASTLSSGSSPLRGGGIRAAFDPLSLVIDHPIRWVPDAPHPHLTLTVRTDQRVPSRTLLVPLPIG